MEFCKKILWSDHTLDDRREVAIKVEEVKNEAFSKTQVDGLVKIFDKKMVLNVEKQARNSFPKRVGRWARDQWKEHISHKLWWEMCWIFPSCDDSQHMVYNGVSSSTSIYKKCITEVSLRSFYISWENGVCKGYISPFPCEG